MSAGPASARCVHGMLEARCWDCVSPETRENSQRAWDEVVAEFGFATTKSRCFSEARRGKLIPLHHKLYGQVLIPHSLFSQCIDFLYAEQEASS